MPTEIKAQNTTTLASVKAIYDAADQANTLLDGMQAAATAAGTTLDGIYQDAADAQTAADDAQASADNASEYAARALGNLSTVQNITETLNWITAHGTMTLTSDVALDPTHVYFVVDPAGDYVVGGTHYSVVTEPDVDDISTYYELSINESLNNYVATHLAVDSEGLWIIPDAGGNKVLIATGSGSTYTTAGTYIVGKVNGVDTVLAEFTASGTVIGDAAGAHTSIDEDGMQIYSVDSLDNVVNLANIGYGPGISSGGGTADAPYYTLGLRSKATSVYDSTIRYHVGNLVLYGNPQKEYCCKVDIETPEAWTPSHWQLSIGNYSTEEGRANVASGYSSHAEGSATKAFGYEAHSEGSQTIALGDYAHSEGMLTTANGWASHAEGVNTTASGDEAHAEGANTIASAMSSHAEGEQTTASGRFSHAQNERTIAGYDHQTAIGKYNDNQSTNALEIGNGTDINRSNALTIDWLGNVEAAGGGVFGDDVSVTGDVTATGDLYAGGKKVRSSTRVWSGVIWPTVSQGGMTWTDDGLWSSVTAVFSAYESGKAQNYAWHCYTVSRSFIAAHPGEGHAILLINSRLALFGTKYVYFFLDHIAGNDHNDDGQYTARGMTAANNNFVIREIWLNY